MDALRTPEDRFRDLPGFSYAARYTDVESSLRMAYVDEGPRDGRVVLLMHGEPIASAPRTTHRSLHGRADKPLQAHVPGARGQPHERFWGGHFVQEDRGDYIATQMVKWLG